MNNSFKFFIGIIVLSLIGTSAFLIVRDQQTSQSVKPPAQEYLEIKELGLRFPKPIGIDLKYFVQDFTNPESSVAYLSSSELISSSNNSIDCNEQNGPLGAIVKLNKPVSTDRPSIPDNARDFGDYIAYYSGPLAVCSENQDTQKIQTNQIDSLKLSMQQIQLLDGNRGKDFTIESPIQTYNNSSYGFQFEYPTKLKFVENNYSLLSDKISQIQIPQSDYLSTNFVDAAFAISAAYTATVSDCLSINQPQNGDGFKTEVEINGVKYFKTATSGAAAGNLYESQVYRTFTNQKTCLELSTTIHTANIQNFPEGSVTQIDKTLVQKRLNEILNTFKMN